VDIKIEPLPEDRINREVTKSETFRMRRPVADLGTQTEDFHCDCCRARAFPESLSSIGQFKRQMQMLTINGYASKDKNIHNKASPMSKANMQQGCAIKATELAKNQNTTAKTKPKEAKDKKAFPTTDNPRS